jgi:hypothetical protein
VSTVHLIKLCVGAESIEELESWQVQRLAAYKRAGQPTFLRHTTRSMPKRRAELIAGGSLYWVIKGWVACRQRIVGLDQVVGLDGVERCDIVLEPVNHRVDPRPHGPFQGWRYLNAMDAPSDLSSMSAGVADMPEEMRKHLKALGVI